MAGSHCSGSEAPWSERHVKTVATEVVKGRTRNFAPALLPAYMGNISSAAKSEEAWGIFCATVQDAFHMHSLTAVYYDIKELAAEKGWEWPSPSTVWRCWDA